MQAASPTSYSLIYERVVADPREEMEHLCEWWGVPFEDSMLGFDLPFGSFWFNTDREKNIYSQNPVGLFTTVKENDHVVPNIVSHKLLSNYEKDHIEKAVGSLYIKFWGGLERVRDAMLKRRYFVFDLDDTLHEFRKASGAATLATLLRAATEFQIPIQQLKDSYAKVLSIKTAQAFTDGKTSTDYRKGRFAAVLNEFSVTTSEKVLDTLAEIYKSTIEISLELKPGAKSLIGHLRMLGKEIVVITEGPQDAQEWTIEKLGLKNMVDYLATTNHLGVSKIDGIFPRVLDKLHITASDMVYVGDSKERDVIPATQAGIFTIHYSEHENVDLNSSVLKVNTLRKLEHILRLGS